jgi:hypothetical protein
MAFWLKQRFTGKCASDKDQDETIIKVHSKHQKELDLGI